MSNVIQNEFSVVYKGENDIIESSKIAAYPQQALKAGKENMKRPIEIEWHKNETGRVLNSRYYWRSALCIKVSATANPAHCVIVLILPYNWTVKCTVTDTTAETQWGR